MFEKKFKFTNVYCVMAHCIIKKEYIDVISLKNSIVLFKLIRQLILTTNLFILADKEENNLFYDKSLLLDVPMSLVSLPELLV